MKNFAKILLAVGLCAIANAASAAFITGAIGFAGDYLHNGTTLADATAIDIVGDQATVTGAVTGDFASEVSTGDIATYNDFTIGGTPISDLWSIASFTFDLTTMQVDLQLNNLLALSGNGVVSSTTAGLDPTNGVWTFTANSAGQNFTFSSSTAAPEPGIALLIGAGLLGMGMTRRMRKAA